MTQKPESKPKKMLVTFSQVVLGIAIALALPMLFGEIFRIYGQESLALASITMLLLGLLLRKKTNRYLTNALLLGGIIALALATLHTVVPLIIALLLVLRLVLRRISRKTKNAEQRALKAASDAAPTILTNQNITNLIGNITLNLTNAILKDGETELNIRVLVGNVEIWVPYDTEVSISATTLFGTTALFGENRIQAQTEDYDNARRKLRIKISVLLGDIEVKNI